MITRDLEWFFDFREPKEFLLEVTRIINLFDPEQFFLGNHHHKHLEAYVIGYYAVHFVRNHDEKIKVRLCSEDERFPDAQVKIGRDIINVEITEVMEKWRKRGDELKLNRRAKELFPYDCDRNSKSGRKKEEILIDFISEAIRKKIRKNYDKRQKTHLVVLCNIYLWGEHNRIFSDYDEIFRPHLSDFQTISILSSDGKQVVIYRKHGMEFWK